MRGIVQELTVTAAAEGLCFYPSGQRKQRCLQLNYGTGKLSSIQMSAISDASVSMDIYGIVGLLTLGPFSYLIAILDRKQVTQIRGFPVYVVTRVILCPLSSQHEAVKVIDQAREISRQISAKQVGCEVSSDTSDEDDGANAVATENVEQMSPSVSESSTNDDAVGGKSDESGRNFSKVAEDVIGRKGQYGRFTERWFSSKGWSTEKRRAQGMSTDHDGKPRLNSVQEDVGNESLKSEASNKSVQSDVLHPDAPSTLMPRLLRTARTLLESRSFFFAYEYDITRRTGTQNESYSNLPLHKSVDPTFFWNRHLLSFLIEDGHHSLVLPLMQGFVGQRTFSLTKKSGDPSYQTTAGVVEDPQQPDKVADDGNYVITLISRRSCKRPGLRYLRRGVDDSGDTANTVETEQILTRASWAPSDKLYSLTQVRGSIPLFFSQSPYSFKPVPVMQHSPEANQRALRLHFDKLVKQYGDVQIALLVDRTGREADIGRVYEESIARLNAEGGIDDRRINFEWFDFHEACRGMKFENVKTLIEALESKMDAYGETVEMQGKIQQWQSGVLRTNCMDCLDRTNVVQSACGQKALEQQLGKEGLKVDLFTDPDTKWFNALWADNGDQISREYSSTAALKGDYTRTRQRNYRGAINDLGLTLSRYYNNIVNDYFSQATIDYLLGNVTSQVFDDFEETLESRDPAMSMAKIRTNAIETSSKIVIVDRQEEMIGGWAFLSPREANSVRTFPFEECVLLVTNAALYHVKFDWVVEKVASFERVELGKIIGIVRGTYIVSTLAAKQINAEKNVGLLVRYEPGVSHLARVNTRTLNSSVSFDSIDPATSAEVPSQKGKIQQNAATTKVLAFKALPSQDSLNSMDSQEGQTISEKDLVDNVCEAIQRAALNGREDVADFIEGADIMSLEEAKKSTGLLEQWGHSLKKLVWA